MATGRIKIPHRSGAESFYFLPQTDAKLSLHDTT